MFCHPRTHVKVYFLLCKSLAKASSSVFLLWLNSSSSFSCSCRPCTSRWWSWSPLPLGTLTTIFLAGWYQNQTWDATGDRQENDFHCLEGSYPADTATLLESAQAHKRSTCSLYIVQILACSALERKLKSNWIISISLFLPFFLFSRQFLFLPDLLDSHHYRRYLSPVSCSRQIPFASKCIPPAQAKTRGANSSCRLKHNLAFLFQCLSWQLKLLLQSCHVSLLEELQPWAELKLCKAGVFIPYILQMGSLSSGR